MKTKQKSNLVSEDEERIVNYLQEHYLQQVNDASKDVCPKENFYSKYGKRLLDLLIAAPICILLLPINFIIGVLTLFDVGLPLFYKQIRIGKNNKPFTMVKFRNMNEKRDNKGKLLPAKDRVTKFGRIMRRYSLDELLNLWNVVKGEMSIIGPRPLPSFFYERMSNRHKKRTIVRPGLECPRMIGMTEDEVGYYQLQFENDIWYVENISFLTDIKMIFQLIRMVFDISDRSKHADVGTYFVGYNANGNALSLRLAKEQYPDILSGEKTE